MTPQPQREFHPIVLAAYVDGELDPATRVQVEAWIATHPELEACLQEQAELSPTNDVLWSQLELPNPSSAAWKLAFEAIATRLNSVASETKPAPASTPRLRVWAAGVLGFATVAALISWVLITSGSQDENLSTPPDQAIVQLSRPPAVLEMPKLTIASDHDVEIHRAEGTASAALVVGTPPLSGPLVLASSEDLELEQAPPHPAWGTAGPNIIPSPGDAPMIFVLPWR